MISVVLLQQGLVRSRSLARNAVYHPVTLLSRFNDLQALYVGAQGEREQGGTSWLCETVQGCGARSDRQGTNIDTSLVERPKRLNACGLWHMNGHPSTETVD